ncbi:CAP domain-containing protein [Cognatishimia sp. F0-27]|nr:CAP domain-containing protein [Cognatishimia sp. F0-27]
MAALGAGLLAGCAGQTVQSSFEPVGYRSVERTDPTLTSSSSVAEIGPVLNAFRSAQQRGTLTRVAALDQAARAHARDMVRNNFFEHTGSNGSTVSDRVRKAGYSYCLVAENLAYGQKDVQAAMDSWEKSPGHRRNLLNPQLREFGFAREGLYWVMVLGNPGC